MVKDSATGGNDPGRSPANAERGDLGERHLRLPDVISQSIGFMGPVFSVAFLMPLIVGAGFSGKGAGVATPISVIVAALGTAGIAWLISCYARRIHAAGALYDYVTRAAGRRVGFVAGWAYYGAGLATFAAGTVVIVAGTLADFLDARIGIHVAWWILALGLTGFVWALVCRGVRLATRAQLVLVGFSAAAVLAFSLWVIVKGGAHGNSLDPFNPAKTSFTGIFFGVLYGVALFIGFESAANLSEETENPARAIPRALFIALGLGAAYFVVCAYAQAIGFGLDAKAWASSSTPLFVLGANPKFGSTTLSDVLVVIVLIDGLAVAIGSWVATTRGIFTLARDRTIPPVLARTHPTYGTPVAAATFLALATAAMVVIMALTNGLLSRGDPAHQLPQYYPFWAWLASLGPFLFVFVYFLISTTAIRGLWRTERRAPLLVASAVGTLLTIGTLFGAVYKAPSPFNSIPWVAAAWVAIGAAIVLLRRRAHVPALDGDPVAVEVAPALERILP